MNEVWTSARGVSPMIMEVLDVGVVAAKAILSAEADRVEATEKANASELAAETARQDAIAAAARADGSASPEDAAPASAGATVV